MNLKLIGCFSYFARQSISKRLPDVRSLFRNYKQKLNGNFDPKNVAKMNLMKITVPRDCQPLRDPYSSYHECIKIRKRWLRLLNFKFNPSNVTKKNRSWMKYYIAFSCLIALFFIMRSPLRILFLLVLIVFYRYAKDNSTKKR